MRHEFVTNSCLDEEANEVHSRFLDERARAMPQQAHSEVDTNFEAFVDQLPKIIQSHYGQFALLRRREILGYYATALDAATEGYRRFGEGGFSVQEVTDESDNLGFYSYAGGTGQA